MKKLSKRILAILLSVLLVIVSLPFTAVTAFADNESDLLAAMTQFENRANELKSGDSPVIYTNLSNTYTKYVDVCSLYARQTSDDWRVEKPTDEEVAAAISAYNEEYAKMQPWSAKTGTFVPKFGSSSVQPTSDYYANVLYSDGANQSDWYANGNGRVGQSYNANLISWDYWTTVAAFYANTVLLYDGKTKPKFPVVAGVTLGHHGNYSSSSSLVLENITLSNGELDLIGEWQGSTKGHENDTEGLVSVPTWTDIDSTDSTYTTISNVSNVRDREPTDGSVYNSNKTEGYYQPYRNAIEFNPSSFNNSTMKIDTTYWAAGIGFYYWNGWGNTTRFGDGQSWTNNIIGDNGYDIYGEDVDGNDIYVINYKKLVSAMNSCLDKNAEYLPSGTASEDTVAAFREGSLEPIFAALEKAMAFDPQGSDYNYSSNIANAVAACGSDIDEISNELSTASPNAYAAKVNDLRKAIEQYKTKINSHKVWSNMYTAYRWYITAQKYSDAYKYGNRTEFNPTIDEVTTRLVAAVNNMGDMSAEYNYINQKVFSGDVAEETKSDDYNAAFKNLVYAGTLPAYAGKDVDRKDNPPSYVELLFRRHGAKVGTLGWDAGPLTYLWVPYTVSVYDGDGDTEMTVPTMVGCAMFAGGLGYENYGNFYSYYSLTDSLKFKHNWRTAQVSADSEVQSFNSAIQGRDASVNYELGLNSDIAASTEIKTHQRTDNGRNQDDPFTFMANTLQIEKPSEFDTASSDSLSKYLKEINSMDVGFEDYRHSSFGTADNYDSYKSTQVDSDNEITFTGNISIYVINYAPVKALETNNESLLMASDFDISNYLEGGLEEYFKEMDKLTTVDPRNYSYDNDTYAASSTQCATDIMNLMSETKLSPTVAPEDNDDLDNCVQDESTTPSTGGEGDEGYNPEAYYTNLENVLDNVETDQGCYNNDVWGDYSSAVAAARTAMASIADPIEYEEIDGVQVPTKYRGYADTKATIDALRKAIEEASEKLTPDNSHHLYQFVSQSYDDTRYENVGQFTCNKNPLHDADTADMDTYNALAIAYDSLDFSKYSSQGVNIIKNGKSGFDEILLTDISYTEDEDEIHDMTPEEVAHNEEMKAVATKRNDAMNAIVERKNEIKEQAIAEAVAQGKTDEEIAEIIEHLFDGEPGPAQSLVDSGITELLEAIYDANMDASSSDTHTTRNVTVQKGYIDENGKPARTIITTLGGDIKYGEPYSVAGSDVVGTNDVNYWSVTIDGKETKFKDDGTKTFQTFVTNDMTITAWYTPSAGENQSMMTISDAIGSPIHKFAVNNDVTVSLVDNNTIKIGDEEYSIPSTSSYKIDSWTVNGEAFTESRTAGELASEGVINLVPVTHRVLGTYSIIYNGNYLIRNIKYDYHYRHMAMTPNDSDCLVLTVNGRYIPVNYSGEYEFYANCLFEEFHTLKYNAEEDAYYRWHDDGNGYKYEKVNINADDKFRIKNKLPFTANKVEQDTETPTSWILRATYTMNLADDTEGAMVRNATVTEAGVLYSFNALTADELVLDNIDDTDKGIGRYVSQTQKENNQYSVRINTANGTRYARSYIKYQYEFEGKTISAISYGDIVICEKPE